MVCLRDSAAIRALALLLLLWVGFDFGVHGLFASDFAPIAASGSSSRLGIEESSSAHPAPDHCFCHSTSMGGILPVRTPGLMPAGAHAFDLTVQVVPTDPHPLDRPPQLAA